MNTTEVLRTSPDPGEHTTGSAKVTAPVVVEPTPMPQAPVRRPTRPRVPVTAPTHEAPVFVPVRRDPPPAPAARSNRRSSATAGTAAAATLVALAGTGFACGFQGPGVAAAIEALGLVVGSVGSVVVVAQRADRR